MARTEYGRASDPIGRVPPHSIESEMAVLGALLLGDNKANQEGALLLSPGDFYRDAHRHIFNAIAAIVQRGDPVDIITLQQEMDKAGTLSGIGIEYLLQLSDIEFTTSNLPYYAAIVKDKASARKAIEACSKIAAAAYKDTDGKAITDLFQSEALKLCSVAGDTIGSTAQETAIAVADALLAPVSHGIKCGVGSLDRLTTGLHKSELCLLAANSGGGKSALMGRWATHSAKEGKRWLIASAEMSKVQLMQRMVFAEAGVDSQAYRTSGINAYSKEEIERIKAALSFVAKLPIVFLDSFGESLSFPRIAAEARKMKMTGGIDAFAVDYIQRITPPAGKYESQRVELEAMTKGFADLAINLDCAGLVLSQFGKDGTLKGTQSLYADPHTIIELSEVAAMENGGARLEANIRKQREGATGSVEICFQKPIGRFVDILF